MIRRRLSKEQQKDVDRAMADTERRVDAYDRLASMTRKSATKEEQERQSYMSGWRDGYETARSEWERDGKIG